jgi:hypothetical protein
MRVDVDTIYFSPIGRIFMAGIVPVVTGDFRDKTESQYSAFVSAEVQGNQDVFPREAAIRLTIIVSLISNPTRVPRSHFLFEVLTFSI